MLIGDDADPHSSAGLYGMLAPALARRGIQVTRALTPDVVLDARRLAHYDAVMLFGDHASPAPEQAPALAAFVEGGKGLVAIHAASAMFPASDPFGALIGGRMQASGGAEFRGEIVQRDHPVTKDLQAFDTWEETFAPAQPAPGDRT